MGRSGDGAPAGFAAGRAWAARYADVLRGARTGAPSRAGFAGEKYGRACGVVDGLAASRSLALPHGQASTSGALLALQVRAGGVLVLRPARRARPPHVVERGSQLPGAEPAPRRDRRRRRRPLLPQQHGPAGRGGDLPGGAGRLPRRDGVRPRLALLRRGQRSRRAALVHGRHRGGVRVPRARHPRAHAGGAGARRHDAAAPRIAPLGAAGHRRRVARRPPSGRRARGGRMKASYPRMVVFAGARLSGACGSVEPEVRPQPAARARPSEPSPPPAAVPVERALALDEFAAAVAAAWRRDPAPVAVLPAFTPDPLHPRGTRVFATDAGEWLAEKAIAALAAAAPDLEVWAPEAVVAELARANRSLRDVH